MNVTVGTTGLPASIANTASATLATDRDNSNNSVTVTNSILNPDVVVTKTRDTTSAVGPNQTIVYTVTIVNNGPGPATNVSFSDPRPTGIASWSWSCSGSGMSCPSPATGTSTPITFSGVTMPNGAQLVYTVTALTASSGLPASIAQVATVTVPNDRTPGNNSGTVTNPTALPDVQTTKTRNPTGSVGPGSTITYTVTFRNAGPGAASSVAISDPVPSGVSSMTWTCASSNGATCPAASGTGAISGTVNFPAPSGTNYRR